MKRLLRYAALVGLLCGSTRAQQSLTPSPSGLDEYMETGMEVSGVRAPYYDREGNLQAQLYGGHARILEGGMAEVTSIRIDVYEEDAVVMTLYAPQCFTRVKEEDDAKILVVESEGDVLIELEQMTVSGRGFRFSSDSNRFEIMSESRVLIKDAAGQVKDLEL